MAITDPTKTSDFSGFIPATIAAPIFESARRQSVVQQLVRQVPLGFNGSKIPVVTGRPTAGWVGEGGQKPASAGSMTLKTIEPKKLAAIVVVSAEVVRANPGGYMDTLRPDLAESFAVSFDRAALHDEGPDGTGGAGPFDTFIDQTTKSVTLGTGTTVYNDFVDVLRDLVSDTDASGRRYRLTGFALDDLVEPTIRDAADGNDRPLWSELAQDLDASVLSRTRRGTLLGRPSFMGEGVADDDADTVAYGGDWTKAAWGVVGGINYDVSTEATVTIDGSLVSLWENNLVAIRAEAEYGFVVADPEAFVEIIAGGS